MGPEKNRLSQLLARAFSYTGVASVCHPPKPAARFSLRFDEVFFLKLIKERIDTLAAKREVFGYFDREKRRVCRQKKFKQNAFITYASISSALSHMSRNFVPGQIVILLLLEAVQKCFLYSKGLSGRGVTVCTMQPEPAQKRSPPGITAPSTVARYNMTNHTTTTEKVSGGQSR